jgi:ABC-type sugar transport system ATPase subunit
MLVERKTASDKPTAAPAIPSVLRTAGENEVDPVHITLSSIFKAYGPIQALDDVSVTIRGGEALGLCGHNGAGKSTLLKILTGLEHADAGTITIDGREVNIRDAQEAQREGIALVPQESGLVGALSVAENLFLGDLAEPVITRRRKSRGRARELLALVGLADLDPQRRVETLTTGERKLVDIARVLGRKARVIILDEPTASLSHDEGRRVFAAVKQLVAGGVAVVFVSHRLSEVFELCATITVLADGRHVATQPVSELDRDKLVALMLGDAHTQEREQHTRSTIRSGPQVRVRGLTVAPLLEDVSFDAEPGSIVGIAGQIGSGASEALRAIAGLLPGVHGRLQLDDDLVPLGWGPTAQRAGVCYVPPDRKTEGLFLSHSILANLTSTRLEAFSHLGVIADRARKASAQTLLEIVGVRDHGLRQPVERLSGGNQQKILIGRCIRRSRRELLLLDDPTRGVDVGGREEIHGLIREAAQGNTVIFVSTELDELLDLADVVVTMYKGSVVSTRPRPEVSPAQVLGEMTHSDAAAKGAMA